MIRASRNNQRREVEREGENSNEEAVEAESEPTHTTTIEIHTEEEGEKKEEETFENFKEKYESTEENYSKPSVEDLEETAALELVYIDYSEFEGGATEVYSCPPMAPENPYVDLSAAQVRFLTAQYLQKL